MNRMPDAAIMYAIDRTLCTKDMQDYSFIPRLNMTEDEFWKFSNELGQSEHMDSILAYMYAMVKMSRERNMPLLRNDLVEMGKNVEFFDGVKDWFKRISDFGKKLGMQVEHYVISSGMKEIIEGTESSKNFKSIFACEFLYDENGNAVMKRWWEVTDEDIKKLPDATVWCEAGFDNFRGGGFSSHFKTQAEMPVTMLRANIVDGVGLVLQIAEGYTATLPDKVHDLLDKRTDPTWPTTWFVPRLTGEGAFQDVYSVMANWGANHGAFNYGHIGADLITLASMLRIPVCMHNVEDDKIFRPSAWAAFGMDPEGSDYRACKNYGGLYK